MKRFFLIFVLTTLGCSQNFFNDVSSKSGDDALLFDAKTAVNNQDYQTAIDIIKTKMSLSGQTRADAKEVLASGYAGKCGLNFVTFVNGLSTAVSGSAFILLSTPFVGVVVDPASCLTALNTLESIGTTSARTNDENAFAAIIGMSLMGSAVRLYTDIIPTNGDSTQDAPNISCGLTDPQVDYVVLGFGFMSQNFNYLSTSQLGSSSQTTLNGVINICTNVAGSACTITNPASITPQIRDTIRDLLNTTDYGVGTVVTNGNPIAIAGACP